MRWLTILLILLVLVLQYQLWLGDNSISKMAIMKREIAKLKQQNQQLMARNEVLRNDVEDLQTGKKSIEERARKDLGMIKDTEKFYMVVDEPPPAKPLTEEQPDAIDHQPAVEGKNSSTTVPPLGEAH